MTVFCVGEEKKSRTTVSITTAGRTTVLYCTVMCALQYKWIALISVPTTLLDGLLLFKFHMRRYRPTRRLLPPPTTKMSMILLGLFWNDAMHDAGAWYCDDDDDDDDEDTNYIWWQGSTYRRLVIYCNILTSLPSVQSERTVLYCTLSSFSLSSLHVVFYQSGKTVR